MSSLLCMTLALVDARPPLLAALASTLLLCIASHILAE